MNPHPHFLWANLFRRGQSEKRSLVLTLKENILFSTLSNKELAYLSHLVYERVYQAGEPIFQQNDRGLGTYIIAKGRIAIETKTPEESVLVTVLTEGNFFGEIALVDPNNIRTASAVATERSIVIGFFKPDLAEILERRPAMGVKILHQLSKVLARRLTETTEKITQLSRTLREATGESHTP